MILLHCGILMMLHIKWFENHYDITEAVCLCMCVCGGGLGWGEGEISECRGCKMVVLAKIERLNP